MRMPFSPRFVPFLLVLSAAGGCGKDRSLPAGKPLPPLPPFTDSVAEKLKSIPAEKDFLSGKPGPELEGAAQLAMMSDLRMAARGWRDLKAAWPRSAAALGPLLVSSKIPGEKKARALDWAAGMGGRAAVQLCRLALEGRPDQDVEPRRRAAALLGEIGGPAEVPVLVLRLKYEEYGDPYALAWTARSLALLKNLSGLPYLLRLLGRADLKEEAGRILVEILGMEGIPWKKGGTWADLEKKVRTLKDWWREEGRSHRDQVPSPPAALERELLLRLRKCLMFNMRFQDDAKRRRCADTGGRSSSSPTREGPPFRPSAPVWGTCTGTSGSPPWTRPGSWALTAGSSAPSSFPLWATRRRGSTQWRPWAS